MERGEGTDLATGRDEVRCALTCQCWDCLSWRRHLLKLAAVVALVCGLGGGVAWRSGLWRGDEPPAGVEATLALAAAAGPAWF